jgi:hypothetical protein
MEVHSKKFDCARKMPELKHVIDGEEFDITKSEVVQWLIKQPDILQYIYNKAHGESERAIIYNKERGTWQGVDYGKN